MMRWLLITLIGLLSLGVACSDTDRDGDDDDAAGSDTDGDADGDGDGDSDSDADGDTSGEGCTAMDILFVIDDSGSMGCEQDFLTQSFPQFIQVLEQYSNDNADQVDYRVGVTSTGRSVSYIIDAPGPIPDIPMSESGMNGELAEEGGNRWIDGPGNQAGVTEWFTTAAALGTGGPSYEMPLQCLSLALAKDAPGEVNEGFLREDTLFIAVIITDEDDCSRTDNDFTITSDNCMGPPEDSNLVPLSEYREYLDDLFGGPERYVVVTIAGESGCDGSSYPTTCDEDDSYAGAGGAERLYDFMLNYIGIDDGENGVFADICTTALPDALSAALDKMEVACDEFPPVE